MTVIGVTSRTLTDSDHFVLVGPDLHQDEVNRKIDRDHSALDGPTP